MRQSNLSFKPLTPETWPAFETLFGEKGACGGCWCLWWRSTRREYEKNKGSGNREAIYALTDHEQPLGVLAFLNDQPIGWCSVSPRESLVRMSTSRILKPIDDQAVWSITCLFIKKEFRKQGVSKELVQAACDYAFEKGASCIESYPIIRSESGTPDTFAYVGFDSMFEKAGFEIVKRASETRVIMRKFS